MIHSHIDSTCIHTCGKQVAQDDASTNLSDLDNPMMTHAMAIAKPQGYPNNDGTFNNLMSDPSYKWLSTPLIDLANKNGIVWGGTFPSFYDPVHFGFDGQYNTNQVVLDLEKKYKISIKNDEAKIKFKESKNKFSYDGRKINIKFR